MAGELGKEDLETVFMAAMIANNNLRAQLHSLMDLKPRFKQLISSCDDDAAGIQELASDLLKVYSDGIEYGAHILSRCLDLAVDNGIQPLCLAFNTALAVIPDEQQFKVLLEQPLSSSPTTQAEAFSLVEAAFNAVRLAHTHHVSRCIELLTGERLPDVASKVPRAPIMFGYPDDPLAAAADHIAKNGLPKSAKATPPATGKGPLQDVDQALTNIHRACSLLHLAIARMVIAIHTIDSFLDPNKVDMLLELTHRVGYSKEDGDPWNLPTCG